MGKRSRSRKISDTGTEITDITKIKSSSVGRITKTASASLSEEQIRLRAFEIYCRRGGTPGNEVEDWLRAERELQEEQQKSV